MSLPLESPICYRCQKEALLCRCGLLDGQDLITLTVETTAVTGKEAGIRRWVSLANKHPHGRKAEAEGFADQILEMGFLAALAKEEKTVIMMALDYAQWAFQSLDSAKDANWEFTSPEAADQELLHHRDELAPVAIHLFVQCRWSAMTVAHANLMYNAIQSYRPATRLKFTMQQMWDGIAFVRNVYRTLSTNQAYSFEAFQHLVKQPAILPAMVSQYGLSAQQFDQLMAHLIQTGNEDLRWLLAISLQANAVLEEILGWRVSFLRSDVMDSRAASKLELLRPPTRFSILSEQTILKLANSNICPVAAWIVLDLKCEHAAGKYTNPKRFQRMLKTNEYAMAYLVHDKRSFSIPRLAPTVKAEIAAALAAALGITIQPYEVQPLLDACRRNYSRQTWDPKDEHKRCAYCRIRSNMLCSSCHKQSYCSKKCQRRDWKKHKLTCCQ